MHRAHMHNTYMYSYICTPQFTRIIIFALCKGVRHSLTLIAEFRIVTLNSTRRVMRNRGSGFRLTLLVSRNRTSKKSFVSRKLKAHITVFVSSSFNLRYDNRNPPDNNEVSRRPKTKRFNNIANQMTTIPDNDYHQPKLRTKDSRLSIQTNHFRFTWL